MTAETGASPTSAEPSRLRAFDPALAAALLASILWSTSFLGSKYMLAAWRPLTAASLRVGAATVFIFLGMRLTRQRIQIPRDRRGWTMVLLVSLTGFGVLYPLQLSGLARITSGLSAAIMLTAPIFVVLFGILLLAESLDRRKGLALVLGVVGGIVLLSGGGGTLIGGEGFLSGSLLTLGASACFALSAVLSRIASRTVDPASITFWAMLLAFLTLCTMSLAIDRPDVHAIVGTATPSAWVALAYLSVVCSALCYFAWYYALANASAKAIAPTMYIKTPAAVLLGVFVAHEALTPSLVVGTAVVMFGVWLAAERTPRARA